jgi:UrcA family protein
MSTFLKATAAALALLVLPVALASADDRDTKRTVVYYGDLDLAKAGDRAKLDSRLAEAARKVCARPGDNIRDRFMTRDRKRCMAQALDRAYASIRAGGRYVAIEGEPLTP